MVGEIVGDYCLAGDTSPPPFPFVRGLGWLGGEHQVVSTQRAARALLGQQALSVLVVELSVRWDVADDRRDGVALAGRAGLRSVIVMVDLQ